MIWVVTVDVAVSGDTGIDVFRQVDGALGEATLVATKGVAVDVRIADVNRDGGNDLVASDDQRVAVYPDVDGDGRPDLATAHGGWWQAGVLQQRPDGLLGREQLPLLPAPAASHYDQRGIAVGDLTGDGKPDLVLADYIHGVEVLPRA